jgi:hypothetical protein
VLRSASTDRSTSPAQAFRRAVIARWIRMNAHSGTPVAILRLAVHSGRLDFLLDSFVHSVESLPVTW